MDQTSSQQVAHHAATSQQTSPFTAPGGSVALVFLMPISFILTLLTIIMLQR